MFRDNAAASDPSEPVTSADMIRSETRPHALDHLPVSGARRGFEGLIINRGRPRDRVPGPSPTAQHRALAAVRTAQSAALQVGIAESLDQIEAANRLICERYAWRARSARGSTPAGRTCCSRGMGSPT